MIKQILSYKLYFPILIGFLLYANVAKLDYNLDDELVTHNHRLTSKGVSAFREILKSPYYQDAMGYEYGYRPIVHLSFALEHELFGESAMVSHLLNLLIYLITVFILIKLLQTLFKEIKPEVLIAVGLLFVFLPIHIETVVSIKNRDELLSLMFACFSFKFLISPKSSYINAFLSILLVILSLYSKKSSYPLFMFIPVLGLIIIKEQQKIYWITALVITIISTIITFDFYLIHSLAILIIAPFCFFLIYNLSYKDGFKDLIISSTYKLSGNYFLSALIILLLYLLKYFTGKIVFEIIMYMVAGWFICIKPENFIVPIVLLLSSVGKSVDHFRNISFVLLTFVLIKRERFGLYVLLFTFLFVLLDLFWERFFASWWILFLLFSFLFFLWAKSIKYFAIVVLLLNLLFAFLQDWETVLYIFGPFSLLCFKNEKLNSKFPLLLGIILSVVTLQVYVTNEVAKIKESQKSETRQPTPNDKQITKERIFSEGRILEYPENSLVESPSNLINITTGLDVLLRYLKLHLIPQPLSFYYGYAEVENKTWTDWTVIVSFIIHAALLFLAIGVFHTHRILSFGIFWYLGSIFIFSNIPVLVAGMMGERLAYTASVGYSIAVGYSFWWGKEWLRKKLNIPEKVQQIKGSVKKVTENVKVPFTNFALYNAYSVVLPVLVLGYYAYIIQARIPQWENHLTLMRHDIQHLKKSAGANNLLAVNLVKYSFEAKTVEEMEAMRREAVSYFKRALEIYPKFFNAAYDLGRTYILLNEFESAKDAFVIAYKIDNQSIIVLEELTKTCFDLNLIAETEYYGNLYISMDPYNEHIHDLVAYIMLKNGQKIKAQNYAERGLQYFPNGQNLRMIYFDSLK